jgi:putative phage-type endonuclease
MGAILGLSPFRTPVDVWLEKTGRAPADDLAERRRDVRFGIYVEQFVALEYERETGRQVQRYTAMLRHPTAPLLGNVDRLVVPEGSKVASHKGMIRARRGLECKTANTFAAFDSEAWGQSGTDQVPPAYLVQTATYLALTQCGVWDLAVLFGNGGREDDLRIYTIIRDLELEREIVARASEWWRRHVVGDLAPEPRNEADLRALFPKSAPQRVEAGEDVAADVAELARLRLQRKAIETAEGTIAVRVKAAIGEADTLVAGDRVLATWKSARDGTATDWQAVAAEGIPADALPELVAKHTTTTTGSRRFLLKD